MKNITCIAWGKEKLTRNEVGINKKLLGENVEHYYCMDCLAEYLDVTTQDIIDKIEEFKDEGCKLFE